jgi:Phage derived protein Gp49-like (DUF891)
MSTLEFYRGAWGTIQLAVQRDGTSLAAKFIDELATPDRNKLLALLKRAADIGPVNINDGEKFKKLEGVIFEFKVFQIRVPCFYNGRSVVLTHGFKKKKDRTPPTEIARALRIMKECSAPNPSVSPSKKARR